MSFLLLLAILSLFSSSFSYPLLRIGSYSTQDVDYSISNSSLKTPINHFPNSSRYAPNDDNLFDLHYYYDSSHYHPHGPLFILSGGETSAKSRLAYLEKGILYILAKTFNGIGVILEHRYYGDSMPFDDLSTDHLRFLSTEQAIEDVAYFVKHARFPGIDPSSVGPVILYGGSYAGGLVAFVRQKFPDLIYGAIASSGVVTAITDFWQYYEPIRLNAPQVCSQVVQNLTENMDHLVSLNDDALTQDLKDTFGLGGVTDIRDFFSVLASTISSWQELNWDPSVSNNEFYDFCNQLTDQSSSHSALDTKFSKYTDGHEWPFFGNYVNYIYKNVVEPSCSVGRSQDSCFGTGDRSYWERNSLSTWPYRSWLYQVCTEWGYYQGGAPKGHPTIVSRYLDVEYNQRYCRWSFSDAKHYQVPSTPDVELINKYGNFDIKHDRLGFVDGSADPWLYATVKSPLAPNGGFRPDTNLQPDYLIVGGIHHWDENGVNSTDPIKTPPVIQEAHDREIDFVKSWLASYYDNILS